MWILKLLGEDPFPRVLIHKLPSTQQRHLRTAKLQLSNPPYELRSISANQVSINASYYAEYFMSGSYRLVVV